MDGSLATAIILGWKAGGLVGALPVECHGEGWRFNSNKAIRVWLPLVSKKASDCMWDGQEMTAFKILLKTEPGLKRDLANQAARKNREARGHRGGKDTSGTYWTVTERRTLRDWHYVK